MATAFNLYETVTCGDPMRPLRQEDALRSIPLVNKLVADLAKWSEFLAIRADSGRLYSDEDHLRLSICEGLRDLEGIDEGNTLPDHIRTLRFELGLAS